MQTKLEQKCSVKRCGQEGSKTTERILHGQRNNGFVKSSAEGAKMVTKFLYCDEKMAKILDDKDSKNIKKASNGSHFRRESSKTSDSGGTGHC